jgi:predicted ATPase
VLCLDDLHWADEATYSWLSYLKRRLAAAPLLVVGAYRTGAEHPPPSPEQASFARPELAQLRHALLRSAVLSEVQLAGLDRAATRQLVAGLLRSGYGEEVLDDVEAHEPLMAQLQRWTSGNPLLLLEVLQALQQSGWQPGQPAALEQAALSPPLQEAVRARLHFLDGLSRQVLEAAAVLGESFRFEQVQQVSGRSELETLDALDMLVAQQLLIEEPERYRFRHLLVQRVVYQGLGHHRRRLLAARRGR